MRDRVVVCMSGGVDSTVAALILKERGHEVAGLTFWFWSFAGAPDYAGRTKCCSIDAATQAAAEVGIPHETIDLSDSFRELVLLDYVKRYRAGETPNPCARCNRLLRFGSALDYARENGFDAVATGHHVRRAEGDGRFTLLRGVDPEKDQSYFLYALQQDELERLVFPVGARTKAEIVEIARSRRLTCAALPESQDLCFALRGETRFLFEEADFAPGPILDLHGRELGRHNGLPNYTVGQRRGLRIPSSQPLYVIDLDPERNAVIVGGTSVLSRTWLAATDASYVSGEPPEDGRKVDAKIRYRSPASPARLETPTARRFALQFKEAQRAITPGQIAAIYDEEQLLGGGTIARVKSNP